MIAATGNSTEPANLPVSKLKSYDPNGNRTHVSGVRGQRPRPLDDGALIFLAAK